MFRPYFLVAALLTLSAAQAQTSLSDQIAAVRAAQENERARQEAIQRAASEQAARAAAQQRAAQMAIERQRIAAQAAAERQRAAEQATLRAEAMADKRRDQDYEDKLRDVEVQRARLRELEERQKLTSDKQRDQAYEDKLRDLDIQQRMLELKRQEVRLSRENDIIDHDLKQQDAQTDVVQSDADAKRSISGGANSSQQRGLAHEDKLRDPEVQQHTLELKRQDMRASRENDVIGHDLKQQDAQTDVVQPDADATRSVSEGGKSSTENQGAAAAGTQGQVEVKIGS